MEMGKDGLAAIPASQCQDLAEVRRQIDGLDRRLVALLGERAAYVRAAAAFKTSPQTVRADDRRRDMLARRREWAVEEGLSPDLVEDLFNRMVDYFIRQEMGVWRAGQPEG